MPESDSSTRLRRSALAFSVASRIGILAVLGSLALLLATPFRGAPSIYWRICFASCVLALVVCSCSCILALVTLGLPFHPSFGGLLLLLGSATILYATVYLDYEKYPYLSFK